MSLKVALGSRRMLCYVSSGSEAVRHLRLSQKEAGSTRGLVEQWASRNWSDCLQQMIQNEDIVSDYPQWPAHRSHRAALLHTEYWKGLMMRSPEA